MIIRKAEQKDIKRIVEIIDEAKTYFKQHNIPQWNTDYPAAVDIEDDIENDGAYVSEEDGIVTGYSFIKVKHDPTYDVIIGGKWLNDGSYAVMHRTCVDNAYKGKGTACMFVEKALEMSENVRADTHELNMPMRRMLEKQGFVKCGIIFVEDGTPRVAYQKTREG